MSGRDQRPFWEELLISSSVLDALSDSSSPSSRPSTVDIPLPHRSAAHRAKPYARGRGSLSLETWVSRNSAVALATPAISGCVITLSHPTGLFLAGCLFISRWL